MDALAEGEKWENVAPAALFESIKDGTGAPSLPGAARSKSLPEKLRIGSSIFQCIQLLEYGSNGIILYALGE